MNCQEGQRPPSGRACSSKPGGYKRRGGLRLRFRKPFYHAFSFLWKDQAGAAGGAPGRDPPL